LPLAGSEQPPQFVFTVLSVEIAVVVDVVGWPR
jgi:hypothetical protein